MQQIRIISKNYGTQLIDLDTFIPEKASISSTIFRIVEHIFNDWYDYNTAPGAPMASDIEGMYYGEYDQPAIYSKRGAIRDGISILIEEAKETGKSILSTSDIIKMDIESAFE